MTARTTTRIRWLFVAAAAVVHLGVWLVVRPDRSGPQWADGTSLELWLAGEALAAVLIGAVAATRTAAAVGVAMGWALVAPHFAFFGEHYDDTLWGIGLFGQVVCAGGAVGLALLARHLVRRDRSRVG